MYCSHCGKQIDDDARFCPYCGTGVTPVMPAGAEGGREAHSGARKTHAGVKNKPKKVLIGIAAACAAAVIVLGLMVSVGRKTINLNDYVMISFEGTDGEGTAKVEYDTEQLAADISSKVKIDGDDKKELIKLVAKEEGLSEDEIPYYVKEYISEMMTPQGMGDLLGQAFSPLGKLDKADNLSNGDKVTFEWDDDDDDESSKEEEEFAKELFDILDIRFTYKNITKVVKGLK